MRETIDYVENGLIDRLERTHEMQRIRQARDTPYIRNWFNLDKIRTVTGIILLKTLWLDGRREAIHILYTTISIDTRKDNSISIDNSWEEESEMVILVNEITERRMRKGKRLTIVYGDPFYHGVRYHEWDKWIIWSDRKRTREVPVDEWKYETRKRREGEERVQSINGTVLYRTPFTSSI